ARGFSRSSTRVRRGATCSVGRGACVVGRSYGHLRSGVTHAMTCPVRTLNAANAFDLRRASRPPSILQTIEPFGEVPTQPSSNDLVVAREPFAALTDPQATTFET